MIPGNLPILICAISPPAGGDMALQTRRPAQQPRAGLARRARQTGILRLLSPRLRRRVDAAIQQGLDHAEMPRVLLVKVAEAVDGLLSAIRRVDGFGIHLAQNLRLQQRGEVPARVGAPLAQMVEPDRPAHESLAGEWQAADDLAVVI